MIASQVWVALAIVVSVIAAKWTSLRLTPLHGADLKAFVWTPVLSVSTWRKRRPRTSAWLRATLVHFTLLSAAVVTSWWLYLRLVPQLRPSTWTQGYLGALPLYLLTHATTLLVELLFSSNGSTYPTHMRWPILARSIDEFWGRRWGTWVADWFRQVIFVRYRRRPFLAVVAVFVASGVWHEVLVDTPVLVFAAVNAMGGWLLYFVVQAAGAVIERKVLQRRPALRYVFAWAIIVLPAPLAVNEATLRVICLYV